MKKLFALLVLFVFLGLGLSACGNSSGGTDSITGEELGGPPAGGGSEVAGEFGTIKWSAPIKGTPRGTQGPTVIPPIISSPALAPDGTIYVGSTDHFLYAFNPDGSMKWRYETGSSIFASPAVGSNGTIYVGSEDRQFYALNPDGTLKWVFPTDSVFTSSAAIAKDGTIYVAATVSDTVVLCSGTKNVRLGNFYAINPDGTLKWVVTLSGVINSSPAVADDGTIYIGADGDIEFNRFAANGCSERAAFPPSTVDPSVPASGFLYAFNANGTLKWAFGALGPVDSSPSIGPDGTVYVGSDGVHYGYGSSVSTVFPVNPQVQGFFYAITSNGKLKWFDDLFGDVDSSPAIGSDGTIYIGSSDNHVWALNPDGTVKWVSPTRDHVKSSPAIAADGTIYIGSNDGSLYALSPDGAAKLRFDSVGSVNSSPSIGVDGTVYFASSGATGDNVDSARLYAITGTNSGLAQSSWPKFRHDLLNTGRH